MLPLVRLPSRSRLSVLCIGFTPGVLLAIALGACQRTGSPAARPSTGEPGTDAITSFVRTLEAPRRAPHAQGRKGDFVVSDRDGLGVVIARGPDRPGHRPLRGALIDLERGGDVSDPLLWLRSGWVGTDGAFHGVRADVVETTTCGAGEGVLVRGHAESVHVESRFCAVASGRFEVRTSVRDLPPGARLADEVNVGTSAALLEAAGAAWEGEHETRLLAAGEGESSLLLEMPKVLARRKLVTIASETFPAPIVLVHPTTDVTRTLRIVRGDALEALARAEVAGPPFAVGVDDARGGEVALFDEQGNLRIRGVVPPGGRNLALPKGFAHAVGLRDADGVVALPPRPFASLTANQLVRVRRGASGRLVVRVRDEVGAKLASRVIVRARGGASDPIFPRKLPRATDRARAFGEANALYALDGEVDVALAPGSYRVIATHGLAHTLERRDIEIREGGEVVLDATLRRAIDGDDWLAADLHLHAAPSPDAPVSLEERIATLVCEGVDVAVATDHNHITDYEPVARAMHVHDHVHTIAGDEITSAGTDLYGHFNAFPLPVPEGANEDGVPVYFGVTPAEMFASARALGARVIQVNHARMPPRIGYFDLVHLDAATGKSDDTFSPDFDALEAFNGIWLASPERVREGARDMVALARRGLRTTATGNSDSHKLLYEEAGYPRTYVRAKREPAEGRRDRFLDALLRGETTVSSGPRVEMTVQGAPIGALVRPDASGNVLVKVRVVAPDWVPVEFVEVWVDDTVKERVPVRPLAAPAASKGLRFEREFRIPLRGDHVILAWAEATRPLEDVLPNADARAIGFTGLVYVDGDGDGKVTVPPATKPASTSGAPSATPARTQSSVRTRRP
jgi:hypothetical protein